MPFDEIAVLLRAPRDYVGLLGHAFARAGIPAWFDRGTGRPHPSGRAFLALIACAVERLSAARFAEYLSLSQVPDAPGAAPAPLPVPPPVDDLFSGFTGVEAPAGRARLRLPTRLPPTARHPPLPRKRRSSWTARCARRGSGRS